MSKQVDNQFLETKLDLRRHLLTKFHAGETLHVLDCCAGDGKIWSNLRREFDVERYWAVDVKRKRGRMNMDSTRILQQPGWTVNVIDVDTYGSPWLHWKYILQNATRPTTVFLTVGTASNMRALDKTTGLMMGLGDLYGKIPMALRARLQPRAVEHQLGMAVDRFDYQEIVEARSSVAQEAHTTRYIGVRISPKTTRNE